MSSKQDSIDEKSENIEYSVQDCQPDNESKYEESKESLSEPLYREWEYCMKDDIVVSSVNNGIEERFMYYYSQPGESQKNEIIELDFENGNDFSFKQEENRVITEGNLNINDEASKINPEIILSPIEEKKEENSLVIEKNENDYMTDDFLNDGEFSQRSHKSHKSNKEELSNNNVAKETLLVTEKIKDPAEIIQTSEKETNLEEKKNINELKLNLNSQLQIQKSESPHIEQIIEIKVTGNLESNEILDKDEKVVKFIESPESQENSKVAGNNERILKNKEEEIKNLHNKLNTQKYQNKLIMDENKKLLEVISIFKMLQNLETQTPSSLTQTTSNFKELKIDNLTPREKEEVNKDFYNTYSNKSNNLVFNSEKNLLKLEQNLNHNELRESSANLDKEKISSIVLKPNNDVYQINDSHSKILGGISNLKKETNLINKINCSNNRYNSNKSDKNANILSISQSYNSNKSNQGKLIETLPRDSEKKVQPKTYITINPTTGPSNKSSYGQIYKGKTVSKPEVQSNTNIWNHSNCIGENKKTEFIRLNSFGGENERAKEKERERDTNSSKISNFSNSNFYNPLNFSNTDKFEKIENLEPNMSHNYQIIKSVEKPISKIALRTLKKTESKESKDGDSHKSQISNAVRTIPIQIKPNVFNENLNLNNLNLNESLSKQQRAPQIYSRPSSKSCLNSNSKHQNNSFSDQKIDPEFDDSKINLNIINNIANTNNISNMSEPLSTSYDHLINLLERYREMNDKLMACLNREDLTVKIDTERRKQDVENLEQILEYINSIKNLPDKNEQEHVIPFYLIDKRKLYENIVNYIYHTKDRGVYNIPTNPKSSKSLSFKK